MQLNRDALEKLSPLSRGVAGVLVVGYAMSVLIPSSLDYFALIVGKTLPMGWNVLTSSVVENSILSVR